MFLCALALAAGAASAQSFPTKPIRLVIGSPAGGGNDLVGRILASKLSENLGQQVIFKAMKNPEIHAKLVGYGFDPIGSTPQEFSVLRKSEEVRWARVIKESDIRSE